MFGIKHRHLKCIIKDVMNTLEKPEDNYFEGYLVNKRGERIPVYIMDRNGFELLAMHISGKRALCAKMEFISAFNMMAEKIAIDKNSSFIEIIQQMAKCIQINSERIFNLEKRVKAIEKNRN